VLDWDERAGNGHWVALHRDLIRLRRTDPVIADQAGHGIVATTPFPTLAAIRFAAPPAPAGHVLGDRLLVVNLGDDLDVATVPDPLFATGLGGGWRTLWSSEHEAYRGRGVRPVDHADGWSFPGRAAVLLAPDAEPLADEDPAR
jgi:maltooligosyltrehalose trehalohydrolase